MEYRFMENTYVVRLDAGEEILTALEKLVMEEDIVLGTVEGIGAVDQLVVGVYNVATQTYEKKKYQGPYEIVSLTGNITRKEEKPYLHLHIGAAGTDNVVIGGHLNQAYISATGELFVRKLNGEVMRERNFQTGLNQFKFGEK